MTPKKNDTTNVQDPPQLKEFKRKVTAVFKFLDELRESGVTNMFGAAPYIEQRFRYDIGTCRKLLQLWMHTYPPNPDEVPPAERVNKMDELNETCALMIDRLGTEVRPKGAA